MNNLIKEKYKVQGINCTSCATMIELDLEDMGVKAKCSYQDQSLEIEYDPNITSSEKIKKVLKKGGYQVKLL